MMVVTINININIGNYMLTTDGIHFGCKQSIHAVYNHHWIASAMYGSPIGSTQ